MCNESISPVSARRARGARPAGACALLLLNAVLSVDAVGQTASLARLAKDVIDVIPPSERVAGQPGEMQIIDSRCPDSERPNLRQHIVAVAVQEWGFFGFPVVDQTAPPPPGSRVGRRAGPLPTWLDREESSRVATSIAGYWSATPDGTWILDRQNGSWRGANGVGARWRDPWSAAFVSWVMCATGIGGQGFVRSIAHHEYIDQAIRGAADPSMQTAYVALDVGKQPIEAGDLLCSSRRNGYRTIADRKRHLGTPARTHCDIVVQVDRERSRILTIGGNVRGTVSLKLQHAEADPNDARLHRSIGYEGRAIFAHLKLRVEPAVLDLREMPTIRALAGDETLRRTVEARLHLELAPNTRPSS